jgi:transcriptional regulator with XRE-family HTH domain
MDPFALAGVLRRIRRTGDWSQRQLADRIGSSKTAVAAAESGTRDLPVSVLARAAAAIGGRLAVLDASGDELAPMDPDAVRDAAGRWFPAHLDTRHGDEDWWHDAHRYSRRRPEYTFDRDRDRRDGRRCRAGTPDDHHTRRPGDSLAERRAARLEEACRRAAARRQAAHQAWVEAGCPTTPDWGTGCTCPPGCEYVEDVNEDLAHAADCTCGCEVA